MPLLYIRPRGTPVSGRDSRPGSCGLPRDRWSRSPGADLRHGRRRRALARRALEAGLLGLVRVADRLADPTAQLAALEDHLLRVHVLDGVQRHPELARVLDPDVDPVGRHCADRAELPATIRDEGLVADLDALRVNRHVPSELVMGWMAARRHPSRAPLGPLMQPSAGAFPDGYRAGKVRARDRGCTRRPR